MAPFAKSLCLCFVIYINYSLLEYSSLHNKEYSHSVSILFNVTNIASFKIIS